MNDFRMSFIRTCLVKDCNSHLYPKHLFPDPTKNLGLFYKWIKVVGLNPEQIKNPIDFRNGRNFVCHRHFSQKMRSGFEILESAVPDLFLPDKTDRLIKFMAPISSSYHNPSDLTQGGRTFDSEYSHNQDEFSFGEANNPYALYSDTTSLYPITPRNNFGKKDEFSSGEANNPYALYSDTTTPISPPEDLTPTNNFGQKDEFSSGEANNPYALYSDTTTPISPPEDLTPTNNFGQKDPMEDIDLSSIAEVVVGEPPSPLLPSSQPPPPLFLPPLSPPPSDEPQTCASSYISCDSTLKGDPIIKEEPDTASLILECTTVYEGDAEMIETIVISDNEDSPDCGPSSVKVKVKQLNDIVTFSPNHVKGPGVTAYFQPNLVPTCLDSKECNKKRAIYILPVKGKCDPDDLLTSSKLQQIVKKNYNGPNKKKLLSALHGATIINSKETNNAPESNDASKINVKPLRLKPKRRQVIQFADSTSSVEKLGEDTVLSPVCKCGHCKKISSGIATRIEGSLYSGDLDPPQASDPMNKFTVSTILSDIEDICCELQQLCQLVIQCVFRLKNINISGPTGVLELSLTNLDNEETSQGKKDNGNVPGASHHRDVNSPNTGCEHSKGKNLFNKPELIVSLKHAKKTQEKNIEVPRRYPSSSTRLFELQKTLKAKDNKIKLLEEEIKFLRKIILCENEKERSSYLENPIVKDTPLLENTHYFGQFEQAMNTNSKENISFNSKADMNKIGLKRPIPEQIISKTHDLIQQRNSIHLVENPCLAHHRSGENRDLEECVQFLDQRKNFKHRGRHSTYENFDEIIIVD